MLLPQVPFEARARSRPTPLTLFRRDEKYRLGENLCLRRRGSPEPLRDVVSDLPINCVHQVVGEPTVQKDVRL